MHIAPGPHGWLSINKPAGISSAEVVSLVKRRFEGVKTGHAGTLDPLASGVLPIALGEATKTISYVMMAEKSYRFSVKWGAETQTDDAEGEITRTSTHIPTAEDIINILPKFTGIIDQIPPDYSAVKVRGKRAHALARLRDKAYDGKLSTSSAKEVLLLAAREIRIDKLNLISAEAAAAHFEVHCGKGAYIRALARDIGRALGTAAYVTALERRSVGKFPIENAISLDFVKEIGHELPLTSQILSIMTVLDDIPAVALTDKEATQLRFGQKMSLDSKRKALLRQTFADLGDTEHPHRAIAVFEKRPVALVVFEDDVLSPSRVLNI